MHVCILYACMCVGVSVSYTCLRANDNFLPPCFNHLLYVCVYVCVYTCITRHFPAAIAGVYTKYLCIYIICVYVRVICVCMYAYDHAFVYLPAIFPQHIVGVPTELTEENERLAAALPPK